MGGCGRSVCSVVHACAWRTTVCPLLAVPNVHWALQPVFTRRQDGITTLPGRTITAQVTSLSRVMPKSGPCTT